MQITMNTTHALECSENVHACALLFVFVSFFFYLSTWLVSLAMRNIYRRDVGLLRAHAHEFAQHMHMKIETYAHAHTHRWKRHLKPECNTI